MFVHVPKSAGSASSSSRQAESAEPVPLFSPAHTEEYNPFMTEPDAIIQDPAWDMLETQEEMAWYRAAKAKAEFETEEVTDEEMKDEDAAEDQTKEEEAAIDETKKEEAEVEEAFQAAVANMPAGDPQTAQLFQALDELQQIAEMTS
jgi:hypothetical protein